MTLNMVANWASAQMQMALFGSDSSGSTLGGLIGFGLDLFMGSFNGPASAITGNFGPPVPSAKGNVFTGPGISAYSNMIVDRPILFPFAKGIGIAGEAGDEAIMPLKRMPSGNLGVEASGGASTDITVKFIDSNGKEIPASETKTANGGKQFDIMLDEAMAANVGKPGSRTAMALQSAFGLTPSLTRR